MSPNSIAQPISSTENGGELTFKEINLLPFFTSFLDTRMLPCEKALFSYTF